eukprot:1144140-Pelagomonas_calceolata.AAC.1
MPRPHLVQWLLCDVNLLFSLPKLRSREQVSGPPPQPPGPPRKGKKRKNLRLPFGRVYLGKSLPLTPTDRGHLYLHPSHKDSIRGPPPCCRPPHAWPGLRNMTVAELDA